MIFKLTCKNCRISNQSRKYINEHLEKINQSLQHTQGDLVVLRLILRKNIDRYHPPRVHPHLHKTYADTKTALAYFEGSITFRLDKKRLYVHFKGQTTDECINTGFNRLFEELEKYKGLHFSNESEYPDRESIRETAHEGSQ